MQLTALQMNEHQSQQLKESARTEVHIAASEAQAAVSDILSRRNRRIVAEAMTGDLFAARAGVGRTVSQRSRWTALVNAAVRQPGTLGFVEVGDGTNWLAETLGCGDQSTWSRTLTKWSRTEPALVVCGSATRRRGRPKLQIVQIPLLTEWLVWTAQANAVALNPRGRDLMWTTTVRALATAAIPQLWPPPSPELARSKADLMIRQLQQEASLS